MKISKTAFTLAFLLFGLSVGLADEFSDASNLVSGASNSGKSIVGQIISWTFALILPIALMGTGIFQAHKFQKQQNEQDKSTFKIYAIMGLGGILGFFAYMLVAMLVSKLMFGDFTRIFAEVIYKFYQTAVAGI